MTLNVDFTPYHSCKLINLDLTSGFHQPLWDRRGGTRTAVHAADTMAGQWSCRGTIRSLHWRPSRHTMGLRGGKLLMFVGLATLAWAAEPADHFIQHGVLDSAAAKLAIGSVHGQPARQLFSMVIGELEAMRDEIGELRAVKAALIERVVRLEHVNDERGEPATVAAKNEEAPLTGGPRTDEDLANQTTGIYMARASGARQLTEDMGACATRGALVAALARVDTVCCTQSQEQCALVPGFEQRLPTSCAAAECACAVRQAYGDCGQFLRTSAEYATHPVRLRLRQRTILASTRHRSLRCDRSRSKALRSQSKDAPA